LLSRQCAAVTTASVSCSAMSPVTSRNVVFPILVCIGMAETPRAAELGFILTRLTQSAGQPIPVPAGVPPAGLPPEEVPGALGHALGELERPGSVDRDYSPGASVARLTTHRSANATHVNPVGL